MDLQSSYNLLGVSYSCTDDELKKAWRKAAHLYHPDKPTGNEAKFKAVKMAYDGIVEHRAKYGVGGGIYMDGDSETIVTYSWGNVTVQYHTGHGFNADAMNAQARADALRRKYNEQQEALRRFRESMRGFGSSGTV